MTTWILALALLQDPDRPVIRPVKPNPNPVEPRQQDFKPKEGVCDRNCHENMACPEMAAACRACRRQMALCATHGTLCQACADKHEVCAFCAKVLPGSKAAAAKKLAEAIEKDLPGHRMGRAITRIGLPRATFYMILHSGSPCKTCAPHSEPLGVIETKDEKDEGTAKLIRTEADLAELLRRLKVKEAETAATLVQAMWEPIQGGLEKKSDTEFEFKKGRAYWKLDVLRDPEGIVTDLKVQDTGRASQ